MPELPEVENLKVALVAAGITGRQITAAEVGWERTVGGSAERFIAQVMNAKFTEPYRRAKFLILRLDNGSELVTHLRMSGRLSFVKPQTTRTGYERVVLKTDGDRELRFHDPRKFGRMLAVADSAPLLGDLAPEPFCSDFNVTYLQKRLNATNRALKALLLDQRAVVAGLGNIYVDEALWLAGLHPATAASAVGAKKAALLYDAVVTVLKKGIANLGTSLGEGQTNFRLPDGTGENQESLNVFQRTGQECFRCGIAVKRLIVASRSTHICPKCQRLKR